MIHLVVCGGVLRLHGGMLWQHGRVLLVRGGVLEPSQAGGGVLCLSGQLLTHLPSLQGQPLSLQSSFFSQGIQHFVMIK